MQYAIRYLMYEYLIQLKRIKILAIKIGTIVCIFGIGITLSYSNASPTTIDEWALPFVQGVTLIAMFSESFSYFKSSIQGGAIIRDATFPLSTTTRILLNALSSLTANLIIFAGILCIIRPTAIIKIGHLPLMPMVATITTITMLGMAFAVTTEATGIIARVAFLAISATYIWATSKAIILNDEQNPAIITYTISAILNPVALLFLVQAVDKITISKMTSPGSKSINRNTPDEPSGGQQQATPGNSHKTGERSKVKN